MSEKWDVRDNYGNKLGEVRESSNVEDDVATGATYLLLGGLAILAIVAVVALFGVFILLFKWAKFTWSNPKVGLSLSAIPIALAIGGFLLIDHYEVAPTTASPVNYYSTASVPTAIPKNTSIFPGGKYRAEIKQSSITESGIAFRVQVYGLADVAPPTRSCLYESDTSKGSHYSKYFIPHAVETLEKSPGGTYYDVILRYSVVLLPGKYYFFKYGGCSLEYSPVPVYP